MNNFSTLALLRSISFSSVSIIDSVKNDEFLSSRGLPFDFFALFWFSIFCVAEKLFSFMKNQSLLELQSISDTIIDNFVIKVTRIRLWIFQRKSDDIFWSSNSRIFYCFDVICTNSHYSNTITLTDNLSIGKPIIESANILSSVFERDYLVLNISSSEWNEFLTWFLFSTPQS